MSFTQWVVYKEDAGMAAALDPISPIVGSDSLSIHRNGTGFKKVNVNPGVSITHGFTFGRMRSLFKFRDGSSGDNFGFACMMDQENLSGGSGNAYGIVYRLGVGGGDRVDIVRWTAGLTGSPSVLASSAVLTRSTYGVTPNYIVAMDATWRLDIANYDGVLFQVQIGTQVDYSDLATVITYVDTASPLTSTVNEALTYHGEFITQRVYYDNTFLVPRIAG